MIELPNRSLTPRDGTMFVIEDLKLELSEWMKDTPIDVMARMVVWHTHPGGHIGPSKDDIDNAIPGITFLVITLTAKGTVIPTWYWAREELEG